MKNTARTLAILALALTAGAAAWSATTEKKAGGLRTNYSKIVIDNLPIGHAINLTQLANLPLVIGNNFDTNISVNIVARVPSSPRAGYEPIPDAAWLTPSTSTVEIAGNAEQKVDVVLTLPNDHYLYGRKFQVDLAILSSQGAEDGGVRFAYELTGSLLFSIAPVANEEALNLAMAQPLNAAYTLTPPRVDLYEIAPGMRVQVVDPTGLPVQLSNDSETPQRFALASVDPASTPFTPDPGSQFGGTPTDVAIAASNLEIPPHESKPLSLVVSVPEKANMSAGPLVYLVSVRNGETQIVEQYVKIYLWAGKRPPKAQLGSL